MILTSNKNDLIQKLLHSLNNVFRMKDMGDVHYFLGIQVHHTHDGLFLNQSKYAQDLLVAAGMQYCAIMPTPLPIKLDNLQGQDEFFSEPSYFRSLAGNSVFDTHASWSVVLYQLHMLKMHQPSVSDFNLLKRILRYVKGTTKMGSGIKKKTDSTLVCYSDID